MSEKAMTGAERQRLHKERIRAQGFQQMTFWVHRNDVALAEEFKDKLVKPHVDDRHHEQP